MNVLHIGKRFYAHIEDPDAPFRPLCGAVIKQSLAVVTRTRDVPEDETVICKRCRSLAEKGSSPVYRRVVSSTWYSAKSMLASSFRVGRWWELTLECGHVETRRLRYRDEKAAWGSSFDLAQALPPPKRVICKQCSKEK